LDRKEGPTTTIPGKILVAQEIPPGKFWSGIVKKDQILRVIDLEGKQAVDFLCYNAQRPEERYNAPNTIKASGTLQLTKGHVLYSDKARSIFTVIEDTCGSHDTIAGCCSAWSNEMLYGVKDTPGCRENFLSALKALNLDWKDIVPNVNFFCNVPVYENGRLAESVFAEPPSRPDDFLDLRAEMDALAILSNCPQVNNPCNASNPTPIRVMVWQVSGRRNDSDSQNNVP
jgi:urea carboxylase-associated protein 1